MGSFGAIVVTFSIPREGLLKGISSVVSGSGHRSDGYHIATGFESGSRVVLLSG